MTIKYLKQIKSDMYMNRNNEMSSRTEKVVVRRIQG